MTEREDFLLEANNLPTKDGQAIKITGDTVIEQNIIHRVIETSRIAGLIKAPLPERNRILSDCVRIIENDTDIRPGSAEFVDYGQAVMFTAKKMNDENIEITWSTI